MATSIPRGIQAVVWKNKDKSTSVRYRVRIKRKDYKEDRLFDTLEEAKEFLQLSKSKIGREQIFLKTEKETQEQKFIQEYFLQPPLIEYVKMYLQKYVNTLPSETDLEKRRRDNQKSFLNILINTEVEQNPENGGITSFYAPRPKLKLGDFKPIDITEYQIQSYIKERLAKKISPISIERELGKLSNVFKKLPQIDPTLKNIKNPAVGYDKELLKFTDKQKVSAIKKREFRLTKSDEEKLLLALDKHPNPDFKRIVLLALFTAMRRSEIVTLTWAQIKENYIQLYVTKSGKPRKVYLTVEAKELLKTMERKNDDSNVFSYKLLGFQGSFDKWKEINGLDHIRFHDFRREAISRMVEKFGGESSLLITEILGIQNVAKFEELHGGHSHQSLEREDDLRKNVGHSSKQITKIYTNLS